MLDGSPYALALHAAHYGGRRLAGEVRVFRIVFEVSSAKRIPVYVHRRSQKHVHSIFFNFIAHSFSYAFHGFRVPGAGKQGGDGEMRAAAGDSQPRRAVSHYDGRNAESRDGCSGPGRPGDDYVGLSHRSGIGGESRHTLTHHQSRLFFESHGVQHFLYVVGAKYRRILRRATDRERGTEERTCNQAD